MRLWMILLASLHALLVALAAVGGSLGDGGPAFAYAVVLVWQPLAAVVLLVAVARPPALRRTALAVAGLAVIADGTLTALIGFGAYDGDWWIPPLFAAVPAVGVWYLATRAQP